MRIDEPLNEYGVYRFGSVAIPKWFGVNLKPPNFMNTAYANDMDAYFHFNHGDCQILPATQVMNYERCRMNIDTNLYFLQMQCESVEEARRRAIVLAYLTYDMTRHLFVKVATGAMLEHPFTHQSIYDTHELYGLEIKNELVDVKTLTYKQQSQQHGGMISTDKDAQEL